MVYFLSKFNILISDKETGNACTAPATVKLDIQDKSGTCLINH